MLKWLSGALLTLTLWTQSAAAGTVLIVGDSISAALGLEPSHGWAALLQKRLSDEGFDDRVINASVSGDTSDGGLARLPALLRESPPQVLIIELGGNDGLRGQDPSQLKRNLAAMIEQGRAAGARVLLLGMKLPPNYGPRYNARFEAVYTQLAEERQVALVPFFLEGVGGVPGMMQDDGIHPNQAAQPHLLENAWTALQPLLEKP